MLRRTTTRTIAASAITLALATAPAGVAAAQDRPPGDLRSADAIDSDLRSAAAAQGGEQGGFDWDDAVIGGVGVLGGVLALGGGAVLVASRRRDAHGPAVPR